MLQPKECENCCEEKLLIDDFRFQKLQAVNDDHKKTLARLCDYPTPLLQQCEHEFTICKDCTATHISTKVAENNLTNITCPHLDCERTLTFDEIKNLASPDVFQLYEDRLNRHTITSDPSFRHCLRPSCGSGSIYTHIDAEEPLIRCEECRFRMCFACQTPWHADQTCAEAQRARNFREHGDPEYAGTTALIDGTTKKCPGDGCGVRIVKGNGCFHMTCSQCRYQFCWECLVEYKLIQRGPENHALGCFFREHPNYHPADVGGETIEAATRGLIL
ncbi:hypothetical protein K491DRAFT_652629 [Lophiostoma macrostomum CBS 122681]|uniref:RBR-type E3 ubiquitin transferase n=1 Tax=Lophiostoma macrostomum CBS 122681 TaxID=1314788 RepID=A0A6A6THH9_9PLEO|nr:hypothetical protein K491DRAFT_652629 [Lophiostoma macrostomum CBS 122681]